MRDVIVIGAGGGGAVIAKELAARGLDVLVLEAGPDAKPELDWTHSEIDALHLSRGRFSFRPSDRSRPPWPRDFLGGAGLVLQISGVGGTTQHYFGNSPRAMPGAFAGYEGPDRDAYDREHRFPFRYEELVPYYEWVERTLPVQTAAMGKKEETFFYGAARAGLAFQKEKDITRPSYRPQENAILQPLGTAGRTTDPERLRYPSAWGCTMCGYCFVGCSEPHSAPRNLRARRSTDNSYAPMALTASRWAPGGRDATLITDAFVVRIEHEPAGDGTVRARGVTFRLTTSGETHREDAKVIVLAAGALETPRLWMQSGLPNPNDWVGRGLTIHYPDMVIGVFPCDVGTTKGAASAARADLPGLGSLEPFDGMPSGAMGALFTIGAGIRGHYAAGRGYEASRPGLWEGPSGRTLGLELKELMSDVGRVFPIVILTDDHVHRDNRISLSDTTSDEHGRAARVELPAFGEKTTANRHALAEKAAEILRAAGARRVLRVDLFPQLVHIHSTMRMGERPEDSVLDATGEARWVQRLFVADNSALANGLGGPNPTLSTQAVATRTAEHVFVKYFGGEPWVGREEPIPSIDDRVTRAVVGDEFPRFVPPPEDHEEPPPATGGGDEAGWCSVGDRPASHSWVPLALAGVGATLLRRAAKRDGDGGDAQARTGAGPPRSEQ